VSWSIIPTLASRVLAAFAEPGRPPWPAGPAARYLAARKGRAIARIEPLVSKLTETEIAQLQRRFAGVHAQQAPGE
jgi:hypothetical protein